ncbi:MAG: hypothetical protein AVDCRST_MAG59-667 [uncultured Thermomicrobiales bacterium]|uniref:DUF4386 family protein n=1 Tax=uncultured Thermomicrobiales bacterium TaxID=1645740 RepID=A0A6J4U3E4_9BACT|nr:MAG: hypothetical protein AVDCRST_MAG59-667 [uncultured Thermomicrobiales bacterium]
MDAKFVDATGASPTEPTAGSGGARPRVPEGATPKTDGPPPRRVLLRIGEGAAVLGAALSVAAGAAFGNRTAGAEAVPLLDYLAALPIWSWPAVQLGFAAGAVLWLAAFVALAEALEDGLARDIGRLAVAAIAVGAAVHLVDSVVSGGALPPLAHAWAVTPAAARPVLVQQADTVLAVLGATWAGVVTFFHGVPFVLAGSAVVVSRVYPGSFAAGGLMFLDLGLLPPWLFIPFAVAVSLWTAAMGFLMWLRSGRPRLASPTEALNRVP